MDPLLFRTRTAVLWVAVAIGALGSLVLALYEPGALEDLLAGEMEGETMSDAWVYFFAIVGILPMALAAATLLLGDRVNRFFNLIAGTIFGAFCGYAVVGELVAGNFSGHALMAAAAGALAFLIAGLGWAALRQETQPASAEGSGQSQPREGMTV